MKKKIELLMHRIPQNSNEIQMWVGGYVQLSMEHDTGYNFKFPEFSNPNDTWNFSFSDWLSVCSKTISLQTRICTSDELEHIHGTHEIIVCWSESHHGDHQASIDLYMRLVIHMTRTTELPGKTMIVIATSKTHEKKTERGEVVI